MNKILTFEHFVNESSINEATIRVDVLNPDSVPLRKLLKKHNVKMELFSRRGPNGDPEVDLTGGRKDLEAVLSSPQGWDDEDLAEYIEESVNKSSINEATIELDVMDPTDKKLVNTLKKLKIGMNIIDWNGPGGGHPAVEFTSDRKSLEKLLDLHFGGKEDWEDMIED